MTLNIGLIAFLLAGPPAGLAQSAAPTVVPGAIEVASVQATLIEEVEVPAREKGQLVILNVREGSLVEAGAELGKLDDEQAQVDLQKAEAELAKAKEESENDVNKRFADKSEEVARAEWVRAQEAVKTYRKSIQETEMDRIRLTAEKAVLQIEQAERDLKIALITTRLAEVAVKAAEVMVERHRITSPIRGMIVEIKRQKGEWVGPGDPCFRVILIDKLRIEGFLTSEQYDATLDGRNAHFYVQLPGKTVEQDFPGKVVFVSPEADAVTGTFRVWAEVDNTDLKLRPGLQGRLVIDPASDATATASADPTNSTGAVETAPVSEVAPALDAPAFDAPKPTAARPASSSTTSTGKPGAKAK
ncbi:MAG TPA: HlyD family efflux transporter periplasmic adaptor subunit [Pirellulales bacterium]